MSVVVSDTSPLRALYHLGLLALLPRQFERVLVPPTVLGELEQPSSRLVPIPLTALGAVQVKTPRDMAHVEALLRKVDPGEAQAIVLALEVAADALLIDEADGRALAAQLGLRTVGVIAVLLRAKREGDVAAIGPLLDRLQSELNFFISDALRTRVLQAAGE